MALKYTGMVLAVYGVVQQYMQMREMSHLVVAWPIEPTELKSRPALLKLFAKAVDNALRLVPLVCCFLRPRVLLFGELDGDAIDMFTTPVPACFHRKLLIALK